MFPTGTGPARAYAPASEPMCTSVKADPKIYFRALGIRRGAEVYRSTIMLAGALAVIFPHAVFALDCLAYLAADEALTAALGERDRVLHEAAAPLREIEAETKRAIAAARVASDEELQVAEIEKMAALQAADDAYREAQWAGGPDRATFQQTMRDLDQAWLKAMDKGDKAGMRAAQEAKAEASAAFRAADEEGTRRKQATRGGKARGGKGVSCPVAGRSRSIRSGG